VDDDSWGGGDLFLDGLDNDDQEDSQLFNGEGKSLLKASQDGRRARQMIMAVSCHWYRIRSSGDGREQNISRSREAFIWSLSGLSV
jgi:hypothetical protein